MFLKTCSFWLLLGSFLVTPHAQADNSKSLLQKGMTAYQDLEFAQAITLFNKHLKQNNLSLQSKLQALTHIAICHYNLGQREKAGASWKRALQLSPKTTLPEGQAPKVIKFFESMRPAPAPVRRIAPLRRAPDITRPITRHTTTPPLPQAPRSFWKTHAFSLIAVGAGVALAATAGVFTGITQGQVDQMSLQAPKGIEQYQSAQGYSVAASALWISGGVLAASGITLFFLGK